MSPRTILLLFCLAVLGACTKPRSQAHEGPLVGIQPYEQFSPALADTVAHAIERCYGFKTVVLPSQALPESAFINVKAPRYRADTLLNHLRRMKPDTLRYMLGLSQKDISTTKRDYLGQIKKPASKYTDWGIFGLAFCPGKSCMVSTFRLKHASTKVFVGRLRKVAIHELGHNLGLPHCPDKQCVMQDAVETINTVDNAPEKLCDICRNEIKNRLR